MTGEGGSVGRWATVLVATALSVLVWFAMSAAAGPPGSPSSLGSGHSIQITPDGSIAVYMATAGLEAVAIDASGPPQLLDAAARSLIGLTPSGSHVVYRADVTGGMELRSVPVNGGTPTRLSDAGGHTSVGRVALADDGSSGVYIAWDGVDQSMWAYTTDGSAPHHLVTAAFSDPAAPVDWMTPDGAHGVYRVGSDLFAIATDGLSDPVQLSGDSAADGSVLAWLASPDSSWVAYTTNNGSGTVPAPLRAARIDGTDRQRLDDPAASAGLEGWGAFEFVGDASTVYFANWDLDREFTAYAAFPETATLVDIGLAGGTVTPDGSELIGSSPLVAAPLAGGPHRPLVNGLSPVVSPDGTLVAYSAIVDGHPVVHVTSLHTPGPATQVGPSVDSALFDVSEEEVAFVEGIWFSSDSRYVVTRTNAETGFGAPMEFYAAQIGEPAVRMTFSSVNEFLRETHVTDEHLLFRDGDDVLWSVELPPLVAPTPTPVPTPTATPTVTPVPTVTPTPTPTSTVEPSATPTVTPIPTGTPEPSPTPIEEVLPPHPDGCTIVGTDGDDVLYGTAEDDVICGLKGDDRIYGRGGADDLRGGGGDDLIWGGRGRDRVSGGAGADQLWGNAGRDVVIGGPGADELRGGGQADRLLGKSGSDVLRGNGGPDILFGGGGPDLLVGGGGVDLLRGGPGVDQLVQ